MNYYAHLNTVFFFVQWNLNIVWFDCLAKYFLPLRKCVYNREFFLSLLNKLFISLPLLSFAHFYEVYWFHVMRLKHFFRINYSPIPNMCGVISRLIAARLYFDCNWCMQCDTFRFLNWVNKLKNSHSMNRVRDMRNVSIAIGAKLNLQIELKRTQMFSSQFRWPSKTLPTFVGREWFVFTRISFEQATNKMRFILMNPFIQSLYFDN